ncbi:hypothetical protein [Sphaerochaeta pleomorpha]
MRKEYFQVSPKVEYRLPKKDFRLWLSYICPVNGGRYIS